MARKIHILNGPNLNRLGKRQPEIYGRTTLQQLEQMCRDRAALYGLEAICLQSNHEGVIIDTIHEACDTSDAIVINPGALTHTSVAVLDALNAFDGPVAEVHISNIHKREAFRHHSYVSGRAECVIAGCGIQGYLMAIDRMAGVLGLEAKA